LQNVIISHQSVFQALQMAIVPGQVLTLADLKAKDGQKLTTMNGELEIKVENGGK
jgi:hypothetical protein